MRRRNLRQTSLMLMILSVFAVDGIPTAEAETTPLRQLVAEEYGIEKFDEIQELSYTFNVIIGDKTITRKWKWEPKDKKVTYFEGGEDGGEYTYHRDKLESQDKDKNIKIDKWFVNDQYWLLFPFHLLWDDHVEITEKGKLQSPIGKEDCRVLEIKYVGGRGYTPDDVYELYIGDDNLIKEWIFRKGGGKPTRITSWENNKKFGPITIATEHYDSEKTFKLWFTGIEVKTR